MKVLLIKFSGIITVLAFLNQMGHCEEFNNETVYFKGNLNLSINPNYNISKHDIVQFELFLELSRDSYKILLKYRPTKSTLDFGYTTQIKNSTIKHNLISIYKRGRTMQLTLFPNPNYDARRELTYLSNQFSKTEQEALFRKLLAEKIPELDNLKEAKIVHYTTDENVFPSDTRFLQFYISSLLYLIDQHALNHLKSYPAWFSGAASSLGNQSLITDVTSANPMGIRGHIAEFIQSKVANGEISHGLSVNVKNQSYTSMSVKWTPTPKGANIKERLAEIHQANNYLGLSSGLEKAEKSTQPIDELIRKEIQREYYNALHLLNFNNGKQIDNIITDKHDIAKVLLLFQY